MSNIPEGLRRLNEICDPDSNTLDCRTIHQAAKLIEDLVKALEYVSEGPRIDDSDSTVAKQALNKFSGWK